MVIIGATSPAGIVDIEKQTGREAAALPPLATPSTSSAGGLAHTSCTPVTGWRERY
jgi:hypothetical protein